MRVKLSMKKRGAQIGNDNAAKTHLLTLTIKELSDMALARENEAGKALSNNPLVYWAIKREDRKLLKKLLDGVKDKKHRYALYVSQVSSNLSQNETVVEKFYAPNDDDAKKVASILRHSSVHAFADKLSPYLQHAKLSRYEDTGYFRRDVEK